jgi:hypothetical protein
MPASPDPANTLQAPQPRKRKPWLLYGCGTLLAIVIVVVLTVVITLWWVQRPIKPVVLSAAEKAEVDEKIDRLNSAKAPAPASNPGPRSGAQPVARNGAPEVPAEPPRNYVPGSKSLRITDREINGLLNLNTDLGNSVRLEFVRDAVNAYVAVPIPKDFPIGGGRTFRARGRLRLSLGNGGAPYAIVEDVTVFGISLPKAWLGGLKGENLFGEALGGRNDSRVLKGIKGLRVESGALVLDVAD